MNFKTTLGLILLGLFIVFCIQNVSDIQIDFLFWSFPISKLLLMILILIIGIFIGLIIPGLFARPAKDVNNKNEGFEKNV